MSITKKKERLRYLWGTPNSVEGDTCGEPVCVYVCVWKGEGQNVSEGGFVKILVNGEDPPSHPPQGKPCYLAVHLASEFI